MFEDIIGMDTWTNIHEFKDGLLGQQKYYIDTKNGEKLILNVSPIDEYDKKKREFELINKLSKLGFKMAMPISFGICNDGKNVYMILTYVEGVVLKDVLPKLNKGTQYILGRKSGDILRAMHSLDLEDQDLLFKTNVQDKIDKLKMHESSLSDDNDKIALKFIYDNVDKVNKNTIGYIHGAFHPENLILTEDGDIAIIDFTSWKVGDIYEEFYKLESSVSNLSVEYCRGQIDEYFGANVPKEFWASNAFYCAYEYLSNKSCSEEFTHDKIIDDFDKFTNVIPKWYVRYEVDED